MQLSHRSPTPAHRVGNPNPNFNPNINPNQILTTAVIEMDKSC